MEAGPGVWCGRAHSGKLAPPTVAHTGSSHCGHQVALHVYWCPENFIQFNRWAAGKHLLLRTWTWQCSLQCQNMHKCSEIFTFYNNHNLFGRGSSYYCFTFLKDTGRYQVTIRMKVYHHKHLWEATFSLEQFLNTEVVLEMFYTPLRSLRWPDDHWSKEVQHLWTGIFP